jgi:hypothetical protein
VLVCQLSGETLTAQDLPDLELLQFLGEFETDEGEWIEPELLLESEFSQLLDALSARTPTPGGTQAIDLTAGQSDTDSEQVQQLDTPDSDERTQE